MKQIFDADGNFLRFCTIPRNPYTCGNCGMYKNAINGVPHWMVCQKKSMKPMKPIAVSSSMNKKPKEKCNKCNKYWSVNANGCRQHICQIPDENQVDNQVEVDDQVNNQLDNGLDKQVDNQVDEQCVLRDEMDDAADTVAATLDPSITSDENDSEVTMITDAYEKKRKRDEEDLCSMENSVKSVQVQCPSSPQVVKLLKDLYSNDLISWSTYDSYMTRYTII